MIDPSYLWNKKKYSYTEDSHASNDTDDIEKLKQWQDDSQIVWECLQFVALEPLD